MSSNTDSSLGRRTAMTTFTVAALVLVSHWAEHLGFMQVMSPAAQNIFIGYPTAFFLLLSGGFLWWGVTRVSDGEEARVKRWLHRSFFAVLALVTWTPRARRAVFERIHRGGDPWQYESSPYEVAKAAAVALLTDRYPIMSIVDAGCANGHLAAQLLDLHPSARLLAIDVSPTAVTAAQHTLRSYAGRVEVVCSDIGAVQIDRPIDLVVMSEVLYYLGGPVQIAKALQGLRPSITAGGLAILAHPPADASVLRGPALAAMGMVKVGEVSVGGALRPVIVTLGRKSHAVMDRMRIV